MTIEPWRQTAATLAVRVPGRSSSSQKTSGSVAGLLAAAATAYAGEVCSYGLPATDAATFVGGKLPSLGPGPAVSSVALEAVAFEELEREFLIGQQLHTVLQTRSTSGALAAERYSAQVVDACAALTMRTTASAALARRVAQQLAALRGGLLESLEDYGDWLAAMRALEPDSERLEIPVRYIAAPRHEEGEVDSQGNLDAVIAVGDWLEGE